MLFVYDTPWDPSGPTENCLAVNDDYHGNQDARLAPVFLPGGTAKIIVASAKYPSSDPRGELDWDFDLSVSTGLLYQPEGPDFALGRAGGEPWYTGNEWTWRWSGTDDPPGWKIDGPNLDHTPAGDLEAWFRLWIARNQNIGPEPVADLVVHNVTTDQELGRLELRREDFTNAPHWAYFKIPFSVEAQQTLAFRVYFHGATDLALERISVIPR